MEHNNTDDNDNIMEHNNTDANDNIIDDTDDEDNINKMILRILDIGILFEYVCTIDIVHLLTSSHILLAFKGNI